MMRLCVIKFSTIVFCVLLSSPFFHFNKAFMILMGFLLSQDDYRKVLIQICLRK